MMEQMNYFLVAHLKSVPLDKLPKKIKETFALIDLDGSGQLTKDEVLLPAYLSSSCMHLTLAPLAITLHKAGVPSIALGKTLRPKPAVLSP